MAAKIYDSAPPPELAPQLQIDRRSSANDIDPAKVQANLEAMAKGELTFPRFASMHFANTQAGSWTYLRGPITAPLLKQVYGDGDSGRCVAVWVTILQFSGDLPNTRKLTNLQLVRLICYLGMVGTLANVHRSCCTG